MDELESQIAKIHISSSKNSSSYVFIVTEKAAGSSAELYVIVELPLLNPAAAESCEKIALAIAAAVRRTYRRPLDENIFENAISQVNEELSKLVSLGQTHWVDRLNCIIGVKAGNVFTVATAGKMSAFLFRNEEFTDISCSSPQPHPLKTFENFASGKLKLNDLLILSTPQLFNYLAIDRFRDTLLDMDFLPATQTIIELLKDNAGPEVAFGTILNLQVPPGQTPNEEIDLEAYTVKPRSGRFGFSSIAGLLRHTLGADKAKRVPKIQAPEIAPSQPAQSQPVQSAVKPSPLHGINMGHLVHGAAGGSKKLAVGAVRLAGSSWGLLKAITHGLNPSTVRTWSPWKKIIVASLAVSLIAVAVSIGIAAKTKKSAQVKLVAAQVLQDADQLVSNAETSLLYKEDKNAHEYLTQAESKLPARDAIPEEQKAAYEALVARIAAAKQKIEKTTEVTATNLGSLGTADRLIKLPQFAAVQLGSTIISYHKNSRLMQDGTLKSSEPIVNAVPVGSNAVVYNGSSLMVWDYTKSLFGSAFSQNVPGKDDYAGLAYYDTNSRVYMANKKTGQIINFAVSDRTVSRPVVANKDHADLSRAQDLAIDGNIYVLTDSTILKFTAGRLQNYSLPFMYTPLSGTGKIYTQKGWKYLYVLDAGNKRILVLDGKGTLVQTLVSRHMTSPKDFMVDEPGKTIYVLNDASLLKLQLP